MDDHLYDILEIYRELSKEDEISYPKCFLCKKNGKQHLKSNMNYCLVCIKTAEISNKRHGDDFLPYNLRKKELTDWTDNFIMAINPSLPCALCKRKNNNLCLMSYDFVKETISDIDLLCKILGEP